jgi:hypothetical protein
MIDDPEIFRAAKLLIDQHGEDAALRAAQRADELLEEGDVGVGGRLPAWKVGTLGGRVLNSAAKAHTRSAP